MIAMKNKISFDILKKSFKNFLSYQFMKIYLRVLKIYNLLHSQNKNNIEMNEPAVEKKARK